ncbi:MAG: hypothetical protein R2751_17435 [Bacteroidales bacterium]
MWCPWPGRSGLIENMVFLYGYRHGDKLTVEMDLDTSGEKYILPMSLQMLLENALKHNEISEEMPFWCGFSRRTACWWSGTASSPGNSRLNRAGGWANIRLRYRLLSDRQVQVETGEGYFQVKIPILHES